MGQKEKWQINIYMKDERIWWALIILSFGVLLDSKQQFVYIDIYIVLNAIAVRTKNRYKKIENMKIGLKF